MRYNSPWPQGIHKNISLYCFHGFLRFQRSPDTKIKRLLQKMTFLFSCEHNLSKGSLLQEAASKVQDCPEVTSCPTARKLRKGFLKSRSSSTTQQVFTEFLLCPWILG